MSAPVPYSVARKLLRTGDVLLFGGTDIVSRFVREVELIEDGVGTYSHVGMVVLGRDLWPPRSPDETRWLSQDGVYLFESTASGKYGDGEPDVTGASRIGVQLRDLDAVAGRLRTSTVGWHALRAEHRSEVPQSFRAEYSRYVGLRYDDSVVDMLATCLRFARILRDCPAFERFRDFLCRACGLDERADGSGRRDNVPSRWLFCSKLVVDVYKDFGILPENVVAGNCMPMDLVVDPDDPTKTFDVDSEIPPLFDPIVAIELGE